jgi:hypothetical protein
VDYKFLIKLNLNLMEQRFVEVPLPLSCTTMNFIHVAPVRDKIVNCERPFEKTAKSVATVEKIPRNYYYFISNEYSMFTIMIML